MDFNISDSYKTLPERWRRYHDEEIKDIKVYKDSEWTIVTNGFCEVNRPTLIAGNYPDRGPVFDHGEHINGNFSRYSTILDAGKIHLTFEHNRGIGEGFHAKLSTKEARQIGRALLEASYMEDVKDGILQHYRMLISAPQWIVDQNKKDCDYIGWDDYVRNKRRCCQG